MKAHIEHFKAFLIGMDAEVKQALHVKREEQERQMTF